jgi:hypothetical protein
MVYFVTPVCAQNRTPTDTTTLLKQKDLIDIMRKLFNVDQKKTDSTRLKKKFQFSLIPAVGSAPGGGRAVATAFNAAFYTGKESTTSLSTITFSPWFTFAGKFVLPIRSLIWLPNDILLSKGDLRYMVYPQYTWGLGGNTDQDHKVLVQYRYVRFYQSFLKKAGKKIFLGAGYNLDYHYNVDVENDSVGTPDIAFFDYINEYKENSVSSGPVVNFLLDSRRNSINPTGGSYFAVDYRFNTEFLGSTSNWQSILVDFRKYFPFKNHGQNLLAIWSYYWGVTKGRASYLDLPSIGWDNYNRSGRGYEQNRYRGKSLLYFESEYRKDITRNGFWGFVVFANLHSVSEYPDNNLVYWHPAAGAGLRIKFNKISGSNIGIDLAMSKNYTGIYLLLGEAF